MAEDIEGRVVWSEVVGSPHMVLAKDYKPFDVSFVTQAEDLLWAPLRCSKGGYTRGLMAHVRDHWRQAAGLGGFTVIRGFPIMGSEGYD